MTRDAPNQALYYGQSLSRAAWAIVRKCRDNLSGGEYDRYLARWLGCLGNCPHVYWGTGSAYRPECGRFYSPVPVEICSICMEATPASVFELGFAEFMEGYDGHVEGYSPSETRIVVELSNYMRTLNAINDPWGRDCIFASRPYVSRVLGSMSQTSFRFVAMPPEENADEGPSHNMLHVAVDQEELDALQSAMSPPESPTDIVEGVLTQAPQNHVQPSMTIPAPE